MKLKTMLGVVFRTELLFLVVLWKKVCSSDVSVSYVGTISEDITVDRDGSAFKDVLDEATPEKFWRRQNNNSSNGNSENVSHAHLILSPLPAPENNVPFYAPSRQSKEIHSTPPDRFRVSDRIIFHSSDGLSYFDDATELEIPYHDCSTSGMTTPPVATEHATVLQLPPSGSGWFNTGGSPVLMVCTSPVRVTVSGDKSYRDYVEGDVLLLEDIDGRGHKLTPLESSENASVLLLSLTQSPRKRGKVTGASGLCGVGGSHHYDILSKAPKRADYLRKAAFMGTGVAVSSGLTYFLGKVAPPVLAVVFGGGCVVVSGTCLVVKGGEALYQELNSRIKKRSMNKMIVELEEKERHEMERQGSSQFYSGTRVANE